nr:serine/threonine protein kinase SRPK1 [Tanacetum cinerariifolium]
PDYSSKNHVRKFLCALSLKWRAKVTAIEETKGLDSLPLDELIGNLKVYKMVLDNDGVASKTTERKVKSLALKAKITREQTSDDNDSQGGSDEDVDKEEAEAFNLMAKNFRTFFHKGNRFELGNRFGNGANRLEETVEIDLGTKVVKAQDKKEFTIIVGGCTKHMTWNRRLFTSYKAYDGGHVVFGSNLKGKVIGGVEYEHVVLTSTSHRVTAATVRKSASMAALVVLKTRASQSRQHSKSELDLTSHLLQSLFDVGSERISIVIVNTLVSL